MKYEHEIDRDILVLKPAGRLDSNTAPEFEKHLIENMELHHNLVLDLSALDYVSSAGLRVLLIGAKRIKQLSGIMVLCALQDSIHQVFEISGFLSILTICNSREEALDKIST